MYLRSVQKSVVQKFMSAFLAKSYSVKSKNMTHKRAWKKDFHKISSHRQYLPEKVCSEMLSSLRQHSFYLRDSLRNTFIVRKD